MPYSLIDDDVSSVAPVRRPQTSYRRVPGLVSGHRYFSPEIGRWGPECDLISYKEIAMRVWDMR